MADRVRLGCDQRWVIQRELEGDQAVPWSELARRVGVHRTTVAREVRANGGRARYNAVAAQVAAEGRRRRPKTSKLCRPGPLRDRVTRELRACRSPAAIAADLRIEGVTERVSTETIYQALYAGNLEVKAVDCLRRRRKRRRVRQERHESKRPGLPNISTRPGHINDRSTPGHWEGDLIIGARNQSAVLTLIERKFRYGRVIDLPNGYTAPDVLAAFSEAFETIPAHLRCSLTLDQGSEWAEWESLAATYDLKVFFCDPHSPWQRGAIENHNGHIRFWLPRGRRLDNVTPAECHAIDNILNNQRRRSLHWATPAELYHQAAAAAA